MCCLNVQEHQSDLEALAEVTMEAQTADEESAALAAQVHQMQMEVSAKQVRHSPVDALHSAAAQTIMSRSSALWVMHKVTSLYFNGCHTIILDTTHIRGVP